MAWIGNFIASAIVKSARFLAWFYYSTIRVSGAGRIPASGPVLLVANHANSIVDPVALGLADQEWIAPKWNAFRDSRSTILEAVPAPGFG